VVVVEGFVFIGAVAVEEFCVVVVLTRNRGAVRAGCLTARFGGLTGAVTDADAASPKPFADAIPAGTKHQSRIFPAIVCVAQPKLDRGA